MLSSCWFFRCCYAVRPQIIVHQVTNYVPLPTEPSASSEMHQYIPCDDDDESLHEVILPTRSSGEVNLSSQSINSTYPPQGPPPPYSKAPSSFGFGRKIGYKL
ncbi:uncharacterized protein [Hetaerina americana]|uniref:uncharacterized protein n=1 Tax=Hetaerina americana TaxID=62018 RepID=UPI003A7F4E09